MNKKKYGVFGGTFDPIHEGHISLAKEAANQMNLDEIIFVPAKLQPFKLDKEVTDPKLRLEMINLAISDYDGFSVSTYEMDKEGISYTYLTLEYFRNVLDGEVYFICGTDSFLMMEKWMEGEKFLRENNLIVGSRPGLEDEMLEEAKERYEKKYSAKVNRIFNKRIDMSSTQARKGNLLELINEKVKSYIDKTGIYK